MVPNNASMNLTTLLHTPGVAQAGVEAKLAAVGLSLAKLAALQALIDAGDALPLNQLADRLSCVRSNITQLVDRLEADGLVRRRTDPHDRRLRLAVLTPAGRRACDEGTRVKASAERDLLCSLSRQEAEQLRTLLGKLAGSTA